MSDSELSLGYRNEKESIFNHLGLIFELEKRETKEQNALKGPTRCKERGS